MTQTLLIAERPFRELRSRAILLPLPKAIGADRPVLVATQAIRTPPAFAPVPPKPDVVALGVTRVILAEIGRAHV